MITVNIDIENATRVLCREIAQICGYIISIAKIVLAQSINVSQCISSVLRIKMTEIKIGPS